MKMLIDGEWVTADKTIPVYNPYTGNLIDTVPRATIDDVRRAIKLSKNFKSKLSAYERSEILRNTASELIQRKEEFQICITNETGMSLKNTSVEVDRSYELLNIAAEESRQIRGETIPLDYIQTPKAKFAITLQEPVGLISVITPFNRPLNQIVVKVAPAIATNNSVILKPSEKTPLTALKFGEVLMNNGLPANMVNIVTGNPDEIGDELITNKNINMIVFTGSVEIGETIASKTKIQNLNLELGGNDVLIIEDDANLELAVKLAVGGAFDSSGQVCRGVKRIIVLEKVADIFVSRLVEATKKLKCGDPLNNETDIGTMISEEAAINVEQAINEAISDGAKLLFGGERKGAFFQPTILDYVSPITKLATKETFGPIAPVIRVPDMQKAIQITNNTKYGLQAGVITNNLKKGFEYATHIQTGAVNINAGPQHGSPNIPFGGVKKSGIGRGGVKYAMREMTNTKTIVLNY